MINDKINTGMKSLGNIIAALMLILCAQTAMADDYAFLNISGEGGENSFRLSQIGKITFGTTDMTVHLTDGSQQQLPLAGLEKMFFSETSSQGVTTTFGLQKISIGDGMLRLQLDEGENAYIYNAGGRLVYSTNRSGTVQIDNLGKGVYIVRVGNAVKKVMTK